MYLYAIKEDVIYATVDDIIMQVTTTKFWTQAFHSTFPDFAPKLWDKIWKGNLDLKLQYGSFIHR